MALCSIRATLRRATRSAVQKRRIGRYADRAFYIRDMRGDPIETSENARERTHEALHIVGDNWEPEFAKSCRIAIGAQHEARALWPHRRHDAGENGHSTELAKPLVATAHPPRKPARENDAKTHAGLH